MKNIPDVLQDLLSLTSKGLVRSEIRELLKLTRQPGIISFAGGLPYSGLFPIEEIKDIIHSILDKEGEIALQYGPTEGDSRLIEFLAGWMKETEGVDVSEDNILVVSGAQQALDLIGKIFIDPGDPLIIGLPSYLGAIQAFKSIRANMVGARLDKQGINVETVEDILRTYTAKAQKIKFVYVVPDFQNPSGVTLSLERRERLLQLCYEYGIVLVEDTPYRDLRFEGEPVPMFRSLDEKGYAFSIHTFSKLLFPGTRLGWIVADKSIQEKLTMAKQPTDLCTSPLNQSIVYEFCRRGLLKTHISNIVELYKKKRDIMINALEEYMPEGSGIDWTHPEGGLFLWITLPENMDAGELFPKAVEKKVAYVVGSAFHFDRSGHNTMRLNFSYPSEEQIDEGIKRLANLIKQELSQTSLF
ncbi:MAG: PLP-dependent aminotransferase family protein [Candidatus Aminicenantes bacterium]|nr:MAG: PLP-dependent aminotransferase family protein [Candidatus Aminicenantes bacterium]